MTGWDREFHRTEAWYENLRRPKDFRPNERMRRRRKSEEECTTKLLFFKSYVCLRLIKEHRHHNHLTIILKKTLKKNNNKKQLYQIPAVVYGQNLMIKPNRLRSLAPSQRLPDLLGTWPRHCLLENSHWTCPWTSITSTAVAPTATQVRPCCSTHFTIFTRSKRHKTARGLG